jgi:serine/threonine protein kinase
MAVMIKHMTEPLPMPSQLNPDLSPAVERVILKALAKEPEARYQSVADMVKSLQEAVNEMPTLASIPKPTQIPIQTAPAALPKEARLAQRPAWLVPILAGRLLVAIAAAITLFFNPTSAEKEQAELSLANAVQPLRVDPCASCYKPAAPYLLLKKLPLLKSPKPRLSRRPGASFPTPAPLMPLAQNDLIWAGTEGG